MELEKAGKKEMLEMVRDISDMVNIHFIRQKEPKGLGHAILCAKTFVGDEPSAVLLGDDVVYNDERPCLKQLIDCYAEYNTSVLGVQTVAFISSLRDIIKSGEGLLAKNSADDLLKVYIESIISNAKSIEHYLKQMLLSGEVLRIDYEYTGTANCEMFISDVQFIIDNCKEINDNAKYLIDKLNI